MVLLVLGVDTVFEAAHIAMWCGMGMAAADAQRTTAEIAFVVVLIFLGSCVFGYIVGHSTSLYSTLLYSTLLYSTIVLYRLHLLH